MKKINYILTLTIISILAVACGGSEDSTNGLSVEVNKELAQKKATLDAKKAELAALRAEVKSLEADIAAIDPEAGANEILVATMVPGKKEFIHSLQLRGSVESKKNVTLSSETMGVIRSVSVTEGQNVSRGDLLVAMDADIMINSMKEIDTQLDLARVVFERQSKLWDKKIGTEIQYLQAKSNFEALNTKKATLQSQINQARVRAPFSGTIDLVNAKAGEMVQPGTPLVRLVNPAEMYIKADVSEAYLGKFKAGDMVTVEIPGEKATLKTKVKSVSSVLNMNNRTFQLEVTLPKTSQYEFRPNQVAVLTIADYTNVEAVVIPTNVILSGKDGKFVYAISKNGDQAVAKKMNVTTGKSSGNTTEIVSGLKGTEKVITKGYREVSDGAAVMIDGAGKVTSK